MKNSIVIQHCLKALCLMMALALLFSAPAWAETGNTGSDEENAMIRIHVIVADEVLTATLDDTPAGRDFAALLPLELKLSDYHATEKIADLPRKLDTGQAPSSYTPQAGDITYYAPWGNLAIFYKPFQAAKGLVRLGAFDDPIDALRQDDAFAVRILLAD
ncbi:MAG: cyclophilin-like fold protein [Candidatus Thiodiazotropha sp.]